MFFTHAIIARTLPFAAYILFLGLNNSLAQVLMPFIQDARWLYALKVAVVALLLAWFWRQYIELNQSVSLRHYSRQNTTTYIVSIFAGLFVFLLWIAPYPAWAMVGNVTGFDPTRLHGQGIDIGLVLIRLSGAALVVPVMEELFWRSFVMRRLHNQNFLQVKPSTVSTLAFLTSAALFALEHSLWLAGLFAGLVYGWLYMRERNLWAPVIAHAVTNGTLGLWVIYTKNWHYW